MKKLLCTLLIIALTGCGEPLTVGNKVYPTYGLFNQNTMKSDKICYEISIGNVVWSVFLVETVIAPVYFIGFSLFNPIYEKGTNGNCGIDRK